jgi:acyl carrier protein
MASTTTRQEILDKIRGVLAEVLDNQSLQLTEGTIADQVEDWDSINQVKLLIGLEDEMHIRFAASEIEGLKNVGALIDLIERKLVV